MSSLNVGTCLKSCTESISCGELPVHVVDQFGCLKLVLHDMILIPVHAILCPHCTIRCPVWQIQLQNKNIQRVRHGIGHLAQMLQSSFVSRLFLCTIVATASLGVVAPVPIFSTVESAAVNVGPCLECWVNRFPASSFTSFTLSQWLCYPAGWSRWKAWHPSLHLSLSGKPITGESWSCSLSSCWCCSRRLWRSKLSVQRPPTIANVGLEESFSFRRL
jgi:hypothetical protein